jgi:hypothetical protein
VSYHTSRSTMRRITSVGDTPGSVAIKRLISWTESLCLRLSRTAPVSVGAAGIRSNRGAAARPSLCPWRPARRYGTDDGPQQAGVRDAVAIQAASRVHRFPSQEAKPERAPAALNSPTRAPPAALRLAARHTRKTVSDAPIQSDGRNASIVFSQRH